MSLGADYRMLGRVNSVYRFFGWGAIPIGALAGGLVVVITDSFASRELALRMPWFVAAAGQLLVLMYAAPRLTSQAMNDARASAMAGDEGRGAVAQVPPTDSIQ